MIAKGNETTNADYFVGVTDPAACAKRGRT
jgi:hypothetical protein